MTSRGPRTMSKGGVLVKNLVSVPGPPPFKNPGSAPVISTRILCYYIYWIFNDLS